MVNHSSPAGFLLLGFSEHPELERILFVVVFASYLLTLAGNTLIILLSALDPRLHSPMYFFLSNLSFLDLCFTTSCVPQMLVHLWGPHKTISFLGCAVQLFIFLLLGTTECVLLTVMAFDRYVAVCHPLRYTTILNHAVIGRIGLLGICRSVAIVSPFILLLRRLPYCGHRVMAHTYCEHMGVARLACANITVNIVYGLTVALLAMGLDSILIAVSYGFILRAVFCLPSRDAQHKALSTCGSHLGVIVAFYVPAFFSFLTHRFGQHRVPRHVHIFLANLYVLVPPVLNPIIYGARTTEIRSRLLRLPRLWKISA